MAEAFKQVGNLPYYWRQEGDVVANVYLDHAGINWHIKIISSSAGELADEVVTGGSKEQAPQAALVWLGLRQEQESGEN